MRKSISPNGAVQAVIAIPIFKQLVAKLVQQLTLGD